MTLQAFEEVSLFQTRFHKVTVEELIQFIVNSTQQDKKTIVGNVNVRAANFAHELPWYRDFLNRSDLVFCDGFGVLLGSRLLGNCVQSCHRMTCPDYIEDLISACEKGGASVFLLAGKPGVTTKAIEKLRAIAPTISIQGHHGYFKKTGAENDAIIEQINQFKPDVLYVGFGMPLQEEWIAKNIDRIDAKVFLPLGACLDFYTDTVYRGPQWATNLGFEWLTRFLSEPQRLWKRYVLGNPLFFYRILKERLSAPSNKPHTTTPNEPQSVHSASIQEQ